MSRTITGPIEYPDGTAVASATIRFVTTRNSYSADGSVPVYTEVTTTTDGSGAMSVALNLGQYRVLMQESGAAHWLTLGNIVVEAGASVELGSLIDSSDTSTVITFADVATQTWVAAYITGGGSAADIAITDLGIGTATAKQLIRVNDAGTAIIGDDPPRELEYFYSQIC